MNDLSRREALRLAKFGAFLATGLCLGADAVASPTKDSEAEPQEKLEKGAVMIKFWSSVNGQAELFQTIECDGSVFGNPLEHETAIMIKFENLKTSHTIKMQSWKSVAYTIKFNSGRVKQMGAQTIKLTKATPGLVYEH